MKKPSEDKSADVEFIVDFGGEPRKVTVEFATGLGDLSFVQAWQQTLGMNPQPDQLDAASFAQVARERFIADSGIGQHYLACAEDFRERVKHDSQCEIGAFILLRCDWFPACEIIGMCHFRRTWSNNIVVDYLGIHPLILPSSSPQGPAPKKVKGVGTALLCFVSRIAVANSCECIWGEATLISHGFYERNFVLEKVQDLFVIPREKFTVFAAKTLDWQLQKDVNTMNMHAVEELYAVEETHPPLVGNRASMGGSKRQLIHHFLDLPRHTQEEIAQMLGLLEDGDREILDDQWLGVLFKRVEQAGKLHDLWNEIEKRHEDGEPENNPFVA